MTDRFKRNITVVEGATKCGDTQTVKSLVQVLDLGLANFQGAQAKFLDWIKLTKQRIADFRMTNL